MPERMIEEPAARNEPIAIIGMGCRYPRAAGLDALWRLLLEGRDAIEPYPGGRFPQLDSIYAEAAAGSRVIATHLGGFLPDVDRFDAAFFGISPREAMFIDPQQRLLMEVSWDALEDAGQIRDTYEGSRAGVFVGMWTTDYENHIYRQPETPEFYLLTGGGRSTACGRLSFAFGFEGPSVSVDTACSSSTVAIHLACQSLRLRECDMALGGGVNVILSSDVTRLFSNAGMLAADGRCKFGDRSANGFVRSEGAGMVVLKRLADAEAAGDAIYAVIRGSAVNNDGRTSGLLVTPSREGQRTMLLEAWRQAGIGGADLCYIEAHGTGTQVGDPVEIGAISDALLRTGAREQVPIGSMKTNIGHTESAAGVAGVIKAALVLHEGIVPRSLHCKLPNPEIDWVNGMIAMATETRELAPAADGKPRVAGASSFGLTGTNAHMVLAEYAEASAGRLEDAVKPTAFLLPLTAYSAESLKKNALRWIEFLDGDWTAGELAEVCYRAGARRTHLPHRLVAVGRDAAELRAQLEAYVAGAAALSPEAGTAAAAPSRVVFVAPGQGSQWDGMARELFEENAAFRVSLTACDQAIAAETGWSLIERLNAPEAAQSLTEIDFVQPALFAMSVALAAAWQSAGVTAGGVVGHSMGEVAAAHLAGILTLEDAAAVICRRSRLMRRLSGSGAMASVELPAAELEQWLQPFAGRVSVAAENSPGTTVVAGEADAIDQLLEWLELKEIFCRRIKVDVASHSALVDPILGELESQLAHLQPHSGTLPFFSTVQGKYADGAELGPPYWVSNLRRPVRLATAVAALASEGYNCFVELSPHPILAPALENTLRSSHAEGAAALPSLLRGNPAWPTLLRSLGRHWILGGKLNWGALTGRGDGPVSHRIRRLPDYAFERERFWPEDSEALPARGVAANATRLSPLLLSRVDEANEPGTSLFAVNADMHSLPYLTDHRVGGAIVFPASAHLEAALEAARVLAPDKAARLTDVALLQALYLSETEATELQLVVGRIPGIAEHFSFALMGRQRGTESARMEQVWTEQAWTLHSRGRIELEEPVPGQASPVFAAMSPIPDDATLRRGTAEEHYRRARRGGLEYGPAFQMVESFWTSKSGGVLRGEAVLRAEGILKASSGLPANGGLAEYVLHPALLDNCFQAMVHLLPRIAGTPASDVYLPLSIRGLQVLRLPSSLPPQERERLIADAVFKAADLQAGTMEFDLRLRSDAGELLVAVDGMTVQRVESRSAPRMMESLFEFGWKALGAVPAPPPGAAIQKHWLIFANSAGDSRPEAGGLLARHMTAQGGRCTVVWPGTAFCALGAGERRLDLLGAEEYELPLEDGPALDTLLGMEAAEAGRFSDVIDLWTLEAAAGEAGAIEPIDSIEAMAAAQRRGLKFIPRLVQAITRAGWTNPPRLWLVTQGTQNLPDSPPKRLAGATVWGLGSVLMREHAELQPALIDLSPEATAVETEAMGRLILAEGPEAARENRIALRSEQAYAARLLPCPLAAKEEYPRPLAEGETYCVEIERPGELDQLRLRSMAHAAPGAGQVAIDVAFAGLNFIDVTKALGIYPGLDPRLPVAMGAECSGRISAVGEGVEGFKIGDEVAAISPSLTRAGLLASRACLPAALVMPKPAGLSLEQAAAAPIAYLTAHYALNELARLRQGEWVLIHAGAGGVGLAAASIALAKGARVIATASSAQKYAFLREWGVEHVLPSRTLEFAEGVMRITGGRGVDVVLNSLAGDLMTKSLEVLAPYGRFVELGKRDIYDDKRVGLKIFRSNISYFAVDLASLIEDKPEQAAEMVRTAMRDIESGRWTLPPVAVFAAVDSSAAFECMAQGRHIGKLVLRFDNPDAGAAGQPLRVLPPRAASAAALFRKDATYLITGGLGGVGMAVAEWMIANGAGHLVLVSRRQPGESEQANLRRLHELGAVVEHRRTDLLDRQAVAGLMTEIEREMPALRGIMHGAAIIDPALVMDLTPERFDSVLEPKMLGTWHLHEAVLGAQLDFFVIFSSMASLLPMPGHGNYSAANAFQDAFAGYRRGLGLAASSLNWTVWTGLGMAQDWASQTIDAYTKEGFGSFGRDQALHVLGQAMRANPVQAAAIDLDASAFRATGQAIPPILREVAGDEAEAAGQSPAALPALAELAQAATHKERLALLIEMLRAETSRVLKLAPEKVGANQRFGQMGIDSLMALEFIRRVNATLGLALAATAVFNYPTPAMLAAQILKRLGMDKMEGPDAAAEATAWPEPARLEDETHGRVTGADSSRNGSEPRVEISDDEALRALLEPGDARYGD